MSTPITDGICGAIAAPVWALVSWRPGSEQNRHKELECCRKERAVEKAISMSSVSTIRPHVSTFSMFLDMAANDFDLVWSEDYDV